MENIRKRAPIFKVDHFIRKICRNFLHSLFNIIYSPATLAWKSRWHNEDIDWIVSYPIRFERDYLKLLHPIRDLNRALHYIWRNRKHIQCFYRVLCNSHSHFRILIGSIRKNSGLTFTAFHNTFTFCSYHILTSSVIYYWTDARQHGSYLFYRNTSESSGEREMLWEHEWTSECFHSWLRYVSSSAPSNYLAVSPRDATPV